MHKWVMMAWIRIANQKKDIFIHISILNAFGKLQSPLSCQTREKVRTCEPSSRTIWPTMLSLWTNRTIHRNVDYKIWMVHKIHININFYVSHKPWNLLVIVSGLPIFSVCSHVCLQHPFSRIKVWKGFCLFWYYGAYSLTF